MKRLHGFRTAATGLTLIVAVASFCVGYSIRADRALAAAPAGRDGNPVGYDLAGRISLKSLMNAANACKAAQGKTCQFELHYVGKIKNSSSSFAPPACPSSAYCVAFMGASMMLRTQDETGATHPATGYANLKITAGTLIFGK